MGRATDGRKTWCALFDNSKIKSAVGPFEASQDIDEILHDSVTHAKARLKQPVPAALTEDRLINKIIAAQAAVHPTPVGS
jgi:hypothetical protein